MPFTPDEETSLVVERPPKKTLSLELNIETLRFYGLCAGVLLLMVGYTVTHAFVRIDEGDDKFIEEKTFIYKTFHFSHTCSVLDFNPAKTVSALVIMLHTSKHVLVECIGFFE